MLSKGDPKNAFPHPGYLEHINIHESFTCETVFGR